MGLQANARVDDDKFLACESESRQCWAGEAWATPLMSAPGNWHGHLVMYLGALAAQTSTERAPVPPAISRGGCIVEQD